jgi:RND family efflux transporter MFP subunit
MAVACAIMAHATAVQAGDLVVQPAPRTELKAVFATVETRTVSPARARIGGTLVELSVAEGDVVTAGAVIGRVLDDKIALRLASADARIAALTAELANARQEADRSVALLARGAGTQQRTDQLRTQVDILTSQIEAARADRAIIDEQASEGAVLAPASGRVLTIPATRGTEVLPGEAIITVGGGGAFLRVAVPERHAQRLTAGTSVAIALEGSGDAGTRPGIIARIYPRIDQGRVIADVTVDGLDDRFVGRRILVHLPIGTRPALAVPSNAIVTRSGVDFVRVRFGDAIRDVAVVIAAPRPVDAGAEVEILSGLTAGDRVVLP